MYPWLSYQQARAYEAEAKRLGVSEVARARKGFMREYELAGSARTMRTRPLLRAWWADATVGRSATTLSRAISRRTASIRPTAATSRSSCGRTCPKGADGEPRFVLPLPKTLT